MCWAYHEKNPAHTQVPTSYGGDCQSPGSMDSGHGNTQCPHSLWGQSMSLKDNDWSCNRTRVPMCMGTWRRRTGRVRQACPPLGRISSNSKWRQWGWNPPRQLHTGAGSGPLNLAHAR
jgi:hypothetical protein